MSNGVPDRISRLRERIRESEHITDDDHDLLLKFSDELEFHGYSVDRHVKLVQHCTMLAGDSRKYDQEELPAVSLSDALGDDSESVENAKELVRWINRNYTNEESNRDFRVALRMFGGHVTPGDAEEEKPASIEQISATTSRDYDPMPDPTKMYKWDEHMVPIIETAKYPREKAILAMAWDAGPRSGEIRGLSVGDIGDHKYGKAVSVDGKTGQRTTVLITSVPYVQDWLDKHPRSNDPTAPLWCDLDSGRDVSYNMKLKMLRKPAQDAAEAGGVRLPAKMEFTRMRKSSASYLAANNVSQVHLENHHGWKRGSAEAARYIAVFGTETDREIARAHGVNVSADDPDPISPLTCVRCDKETPREKAACMWCGQVLGPRAAEAADALDQTLVEDIAEEDDAEARGVALGIYEATKTDPEFRSELLDSYMRRHFDDPPVSASSV